MSKIYFNKMPRYIEKSSRAFLKALTWRVTATLDTIIISLIVTGALDTALQIGFLEFITKFFIYYIHERVWNKVNFGRIIENQDIDYNI